MPHTHLRITSLAATISYLVPEMFDRGKGNARSYPYHSGGPTNRDLSGVHPLGPRRQSAGDLPRTHIILLIGETLMTSLDLHAGAGHGYASAVRGIAAPTCGLGYASLRRGMAQPAAEPA